MHHPEPPIKASERNRWLNDLTLLADQIRGRHANPFWLHPASSFERLVAETRQLTAGSEPVTKAQLLSRFARLVAFADDGHTKVLARQEVFGELPIRYAIYPDGVFVMAAAKEYQKALGCRLIAIDGEAIEALITRLEPYVPFANEGGKRVFMAEALAWLRLLHGTGIVTGKAPTLKLQDPEGTSFELALDATLPSKETVKLETYRPFAQVPLYLRHPEKKYWFEWLAEEGTVYVHYNRVAHMKEESLPRFFTRLFSFIEAQPVQRLVLDLRHNTGGDNYFNAAFVKRVVAHTELNQRGKFFVIIGPRTFSAAIALASDLELKTRAILVGEPSGDPPNFPGDGRRLKLPHSGFQCQISSRFWLNAHTEDPRDALIPGLKAVTYFEDYRTGHDPCMEAILVYREQPRAETNKVHLSEGRYTFEIDRPLIIENTENGSQMGVAQLFQTRLFSEEGRIETDIDGINLFQREKYWYLDYFGKAIKLEPLKSGVTQAFELSRMDRIVEAETAYLELLRRHPKHPLLLPNNQGLRTLMEMECTGNWIAFERRIEMLIRLYPSDFTPRSLLMLNYQKRGKRLRALYHGIRAFITMKRAM